jgi:hypothetical protein
LEKDFPKIPKENGSGQEGLNHYTTGRECLWTTCEKVGFSKAHCEVQKQPNLDFSFRGLNPIPLLLCFCEGTNRFHVGDSKISVIKVGGVSCDGKRNFEWSSIGLRARPHGNFCGAS